MQNTKNAERNPQLDIDQYHTLQKLADILNRPPDDQLRNLCEEHSWNLEECIEYIISHNPNFDTEVDTKATLHGKSKVHGAIPKNINVTPQGLRNDFSQNRTLRSQNGNQPQSANINNNINVNNNNNNATSTVNKIVQDICAGSKIMIIMRGVPGCGKSTLAKSILEQCSLLSNEYSFGDFVYSTDNFFYDQFGRYKFNGAMLSEAHTWNKKRVRERAIAGWSPIFVDNTNVKLWEMMDYVQIAVQNGYIIELLEPKTPWRNSARKLASKNKHGVPTESIQAMLDKFEKASVGDLLKLLKETKYTVPLPQMRAQPPVNMNQKDVETEEVFQISNSERIGSVDSNNIGGQIKHHAWSHFIPEMPKEQRENRRLKIGISTTDGWTPHEEEQRNFWGIPTQTSDPNRVGEEGANKGEKTLLDLLREDANESLIRPSDLKDLKDESAKRKSALQRHSIGCPNESKAFVSLRQIYPNKEIGALWDLFVKCSGDIDWAVDILLKEDDESLSRQHGYSLTPASADAETFQCNCDRDKSSPNILASSSPPVAIPIGPSVKPQRQRTRATRANQTNSDLLAVKEIIENRFKIGDEHYSPHIRQLKETRDRQVKSYSDMEVQTDPAEEEPDDDEANDILEIALGDSLVKQLRDIFDAETPILSERLPDNLPINVFMPRTLAKELYMLWVESAYNQLEEQRQQTLRDDEHFARLLKNPAYENCKQSPENVQELLDVQLAWDIYNKENEKDNDTQIRHHNESLNLASYLTQMKLFDTFPNIPRETLIEVLSAHENSYEKTVNVLNRTINTEQKTTKEPAGVQLQEQELQQTMKKEQQENPVNCSNETEGATEREVKLQPDEAKRLALRDFEETRNMAAHHCQLKAECYQKAKEAIQKGNSAVAVYYSEIANLHKMKIDMYNNRAASCIMDVHRYTQKNPELLDLHYLHAMEAIGCLDLFLDRHITVLRSLSRSYKHVFIITGRGRHSAGGVSTIKNKVKSRLKERNLRWSEVNPGLLKVKIFSASRHSKNV